MFPRQISGTSERERRCRVSIENGDMPAFPDDGNAMVAQEALDEWRLIQHKPAEVERWAYRWAVELCERLGAR
jgi:hypothetical protein